MAAKKIFLSVLAACFAKIALCAAEDCIVTVGEGDVVWSAVGEAGPSALLAGSEKGRRLVKRGKGRLTIKCDLKAAGYAGEIRVEEGYLQLFHDGACGTSAGGVTVLPGATLEGNPSYASGSLVFDCEPLTFGGFGVDGVEGAVKMLGGDTWNFFKNGKKTMTEDSLWVGISRLDVRAGEFDMGGHTLYASNSVAIVHASVKNPGRIVHLPGSKAMVLEGSTKFNGGDTNDFVLLGGTMEWKNFSEPQYWRLAVSNSASIRATVVHDLSRTNLATAIGRNRWEGPVHIAENAKLTATVGGIKSTVGSDPYHHILQLRGRIGGAGSLEVAENGYLRLGCPTNDFAGGVTLMKNSLLEAAGIDSLGPGGVVSMDATAHMEFLYGELREPLLTDGEYKRILSFKNVWHEGKSYYSAGDNLKFTGLPDYSCGAIVDASEISTIYHNEANTLILSRGVGGVPKVVNTGGTLVLGGEGDFFVGDIRVRDGTLRIADGSRYHMGEHVFYLHGTYPMTPRLEVGAGSVLSSRDDATSAMLPVNHVAGGLSNDNLRDFVRGVMEISPGAAVSNILIVGGAKLTSGGNVTAKTNYMGAVYMRGGTLVQQGANSRDEFVVGYNANGYFEMTGGFFDASKRSIWTLVGNKSNHYDTPGHGVMHVKGGRVEHKSVGFGINGGGAYGHLRLSGGVVSNKTLIVGKSAWTGKSGGEGTVTVDGVAEVAVDEDAQFGAMSNSVSILNLNGGAFRPRSFAVLTNLCQMTGQSTQFCEFLEGANNPVYVNFDGGLYAPSLGESRRGWIDPRVCRYTVFAGGAAVDTGAYDRQLHVRFRAPTGNGVKSIPFSCDEPWRYIGSPYVKIVDPSGMGFGASAFADFDSVNGVVTGVTVTSPGCDYGEGTYAEISFGGWTNTVRVAAQLAPNDRSGGFAKYGTGKLELSGTNDWGGVTCVREGGLEMTVEHALPNTAGYEIAAGASVCFGGKPQSGGTLAGAGSLRGDYALSGTFAVNAEDVLAGRCMCIYGNLSIAPGTRVVVRNAELLEGMSASKAVMKVLGGTVTGSLELDATGLSGACVLRRLGSTYRVGPVRGTTFVVR